MSIRFKLNISSNHILAVIEKFQKYEYLQAETMEQWVTDSFYTSFPSYKKQALAANTLAEDRREDYKKYLAEVRIQLFGMISYNKIMFYIRYLIRNCLVQKIAEGQKNNLKIPK